MPFLEWIAELFPEPQAPYTLREIATRLQTMYHPKITYPVVHHAFAYLSKSAVFCDIVKPLNSADKRHFQFSAEAARRIARQAAKRKKPVLLGFDEKSVAKSNLSASNFKTSVAAPATATQN